jgi:hypothetical protein
MKLTLRKLEIPDGRMLEKLVAEHIDGIEPGLAVIDSRLLLGHATIDLVAQDANGSLVLMALGFRADESMMLRIVDAYSWCLEYPDSVHRHYPTLSISEERPPRVVFVMSRVPDSFQRKIKQLSFSAVDAVEFHYFDVNGTPAMYFDTVARIRRAAGAPVVADIVAQPEAPSAPVRLSAEIASRLNGHAAPKRIEIPEIETPRVVTPRTITPEAIIAAINATTQPTPVRIAAPVIAGASDVSVLEIDEAPANTEPVVEIAEPVAEIAEPVVAVEEPVVIAQPIVEIAVPVVEIVEPVVEIEAPVVEIVEPIVEITEAAAPAEPVVVTPEPKIETPPVVAAMPKAETPAAAAVAPKVIAPVSIAAAAKVEAPKVEAPKVEAPKVEAPKAQTPKVEAPKVEAPKVEAAKPVTPKSVTPKVAAPAPVKAEAPAATSEASEAAKAARLAKELGIELPEGALTRQWIDFLNQLASK